MKLLQCLIGFDTERLTKGVHAILARVVTALCASVVVVSRVAVLFLAVLTAVIATEQLRLSICQAFEDLGQYFVVQIDVVTSPSYSESATAADEDGEEESNEEDKAVRHD